MSLETLIRGVKESHPDCSVLGCHAVSVRSVEGEMGVQIRTDRRAIEEAIRDVEGREGVAVVRCEMKDGFHGPGEEFMAIVVAGYSSKKVHAALEEMRIRVCERGAYDLTAVKE
jgi:hypothetical protein